MLGTIGTVVIPRRANRRSRGHFCATYLQFVARVGKAEGIRVLTVHMRHCHWHKPTGKPQGCMVLGQTPAGRAAAGPAAGKGLDLLYTHVEHATFTRIKPRQCKLLNFNFDQWIPLGRAWHAQPRCKIHDWHTSHVACAASAGRPDAPCTAERAAPPASPSCALSKISPPHPPAHSSNNRSTSSSDSTMNGCHSNPHRLGQQSSWYWQFLSCATRSLPWVVGHGSW